MTCRWRIKTSVNQHFKTPVTTRRLHTPGVVHYRTAGPGLANAVGWRLPSAREGTVQPGWPHEIARPLHLCLWRRRLSGWRDPHEVCSLAGTLGRKLTYFIDQATASPLMAKLKAGLLTIPQMPVLPLAKRRGYIILTGNDPRCGVLSFPEACMCKINLRNIRRTVIVLPPNKAGRRCTALAKKRELTRQKLDGNYPAFEIRSSLYRVGWP